MRPGHPGLEVDESLGESKDGLERLQGKRGAEELGEPEVSVTEFANCTAPNMRTANLPAVSSLGG